MFLALERVLDEIGRDEMVGLNLSNLLEKTKEFFVASLLLCKLNCDSISKYVENDSLLVVGV